MADGISATNVALALSAAVGSNALAAQLHKGAPGAAGTANVSSTTVRETVAWGSPSGGSVSATTLPSWPSWAGTSPETVTDLSCWSTLTAGAGTFGLSMQLAASVTMLTGDTLTMTAMTLTITAAS